MSPSDAILLSASPTSAPDLPDSSSWISEVLQERRQAQAVLDQLPRLALSPGLQALIWLLRLYVVFMIVVVGVNVVQTLHG